MDTVFCSFLLVFKAFFWWEGTPLPRSFSEGIVIVQNFNFLPEISGLMSLEPEKCDCYKLVCLSVLEFEDNFS